MSLGLRLFSFSSSRIRARSVRYVELCRPLAGCKTCGKLSARAATLLLVRRGTEYGSESQWHRTACSWFDRWPATVESSWLAVGRRPALVRHIPQLSWLHSRLHSRQTQCSQPSCGVPCFDVFSFRFLDTTIRKKVWDYCRDPPISLLSILGCREADSSGQRLVWKRLPRVNTRLQRKSQQSMFQRANPTAFAH